MGLGATFSNPIAGFCVTLYRDWYKIWSTSKISVSSVHKGQTNLCAIAVLVHVVLKYAPPIILNIVNRWAQFPCEHPVCLEVLNPLWPPFPTMIPWFSPWGTVVLFCSWIDQFLKLHPLSSGPRLSLSSSQSLEFIVHPFSSWLAVPLSLSFFGLSRPLQWIRWVARRQTVARSGPAGCGDRREMLLLVFISSWNTCRTHNRATWYYRECVSVNPVCAPNSLSIKKFCLSLFVHMHFHAYTCVCLCVYWYSARVCAYGH